MIRILALSSLILSAGVRADLTMHGQGSPVAATDSASRYTIYLRDDQMRIDQLKGAEGDEVDSTTIIRFEGSPAGTLYLDHDAKKVTVVPLDTVSQVGQTISVESTGSDPVAPRNETQEILGHTAEGYDFAFTGSFTPAAMAGQEMPPGMADMLKFRMNVTGTAWVVPGMEGAGELASFYAKMAEKGVTFGGVTTETPATNGGERASASGGMTGIMAEIAGKGLPLRTQMQTDVTVEAEGPMAAMLKQAMAGAAGSTRHDTEVTGVSTDDVDAALFYDGGLPEGYEQQVFDGR